MREEEGVFLHVCDDGRGQYPFLNGDGGGGGRRNVGGFGDGDVKEKYCRIESAAERGTIVKGKKTLARD